MKRQGFTLIEMLVVVAIIGICVTLTLPYFVEAQRAAGLRTSSQTVIMTAKYARSMALLKQVDMALLVDKGAGQLELVSLAQPPATSDQEFFLEERSARGLAGQTERPSAGGGPADAAEGEAPPPPTIKTELIRELEEGIVVKDLEVEGEEGRQGEVSWLFFNRNGTSSGFTLRIEDSRGATAEIEMDGLSGLIKVKMRGKDET